MAKRPPKQMIATIYGARGSLSNPCAATQKYGGGTTCLGVETPDGIPLVIDAGTGILELGRELIQRKNCRREIHLFFTHTHWDHVQGMPYFAPFFQEGWTIHLYSLGVKVSSLKDIFSPIYSSRYFPVPFEKLKAKILFHDLQFYETVQVENVTIRCCRVNHPGYALGFRVEHGGKAFFFASDSTPFTDILFGDQFHKREREQSPEVLAEMVTLQARLEEQIQGVDVLLHDANYTDAEYERIFHFGHASMTQTYELAKKCGVPRLYFWHHDRARTDEQVDAIVAPYLVRGQEDGIQVIPARAMDRFSL